MKAKAIGLYVHIPFCLKKCHYCDFCSFSDIDIKTREKYVERLISEINSYKRDEKITLNSIFFGGGTPSVLRADEFVKIFCAIDDSFCISEKSEITIEVNPKTVSSEKLRAYLDCGVNRISIGLQSIHENELKILGRIHSYGDFLDSYRLITEMGFDNVSVDLMYAIPSQTVDSFKKTLYAIAELSPKHISLYSLILEENTKFWDMKDKLRFPTEDEECQMYELAADYLKELGYSHYEISNYAKDGFMSQHNLKYWKDEEYIGVGISAYSYFLGKRYGNTRNMTEYLSENRTNYNYEEIIDGSTNEYEYAMLALRLSSGINLSDYQKKFNKSFLCNREEEIEKYIKNGYMCKDGDRLALTEKGFYVSNTILCDLL